MAATMALPHQLQLYRPNLIAVDQSRRRRPDQADHRNRSQCNRATIGQPTRVARRAKETTLRRQEAKELRATSNVCPPEGIFAGIAPAGRVIMSRGTIGLGVLQPALATMPVPEPTRGGVSPTDTDPEFCKLSGCPPPGEAKYL